MPGGTHITRAAALDQIGYSLGDALPWLLPAGVFLLVLLTEAFLGKKYRSAGMYLTVAGMLVTAVLAFLRVQGPARTAFLGMAQTGPVAALLLGMAALMGIFTVIVSLRAARLREGNRNLGEYWILLNALLTGISMMTIAQHMVFMFLALEMASVPAYLLAAWARTQRKPSEAALKYVLYGAASAGMMVYGMSWLYGFTGSLFLPDGGWEAAPNWQILPLALVTAGFAFKITAAPFHFWAPDVYEGAPYPIVAFFSVAPKAAGVFLFMRFAHAFSGPAMDWIVWTLALLSMVWGTLGAVQQQNFKRLLAYSGVAQTGYLLAGVYAGTSLGSAAVIWYLLVYFSMAFGAFITAGWLSEQTGSDLTQDYRGLGASQPLMAVLVTIFLVGLAGLPPTAGFPAKLQLIFGVLEGRTGWPGMALGITLLLTTVVSLYYYLYIPAQMAFRNPVIKTAPAFHISQRVLLLILALATLIPGIFLFDQVTAMLQKTFPLYIPHIPEIL